MPNYRRAFVPSGCWFFTVNLLERRRTMLVDHAGALRSAFAETGQKYPFDITAIVLLPDHLHAIWTLPPDDANFSTRWRLIKARFAKTLPKQERRSDVRKLRNERGIWQRRFWEHLIRDDADYALQLDGDQLGELGRDVGHRHFRSVQAVSRGEHGADFAESYVRRVMHDGNELVTR